MCIYFCSQKLQQSLLLAGDFVALGEEAIRKTTTWHRVQLVCKKTKHDCREKGYLHNEHLGCSWNLALC